jgi:hypothetical protein
VGTSRKAKGGRKMRTTEEIVRDVLADPENWYISEDEMDTIDWDSAPLTFIEIVGTVL